MHLIIQNLEVKIYVE